MTEDMVRRIVREELAEFWRQIGPALSKPQTQMERALALAEEDAESSSRLTTVEVLAVAELVRRLNLSGAARALGTTREMVRQAAAGRPLRRGSCVLIRMGLAREPVVPLASTPAPR